jgi:hypothetical protein
VDVKILSPGEEEPAPVRWRVGRHYGIHVYEGDEPVATFHDPARALRAVAAVNAALEGPPPGVVGSTDPNDGHRFRFTVTHAGSYGVVGQADHTDADWWSEPSSLLVRAWSLPAACRAAATATLSDWYAPEPSDGAPHQYVVELNGLHGPFENRIAAEEWATRKADETPDVLVSWSVRPVAAP